MACETYPDGSSYCESANGWEYTDAEGNYSYGSWDAQGNQIDANGLALTIADTLASIWGGGRRGYYAPDRQPQPQGGYPQAYYPGNYTPATGTTTGVRAGVTSNSQGIGANISLPKWAVYGLGAVALGYAFGFIKQGRR